jgi:hypothetical protein
MINGRNHKVSTLASSLYAAMEQLKRFDAYLENYNPAFRTSIRSTWTLRSRRSSSWPVST